MTGKDFRFGVNILAAGSRPEWQDTARRVEDLGYDVLLVPDHLGMPAPFPALMSAAEVTTRPRLGTLVLNAGFYKPALLARDVAAVDELSDGRFELGLGAGYVAEEFAAAELPFPSARQRIDHLEHTTVEVNRLLGEAGRRVPVMIAGQGDRVLGMAARHADIVAIAGVRTAPSGGVEPLTDRIEVVRKAAGDRFDRLELSLLISAVHLDGEELDLSMTRRFYPALSDEELLALPGVLHGSAQQIAETLHEYRETYGITYLTAIGPSLEPFGKVISLFR
ncbi:TIGR03621 family F420-dependent LLM class oxidoreductase [Amycolatopsis rhizosphaerae]|uniref:TIGR03621 family F420-dependent LLM class oxidoreductase n=1 Tax=Amycolatopsis rhizosphaerae TaxID=2053003 RepID=A0A558BFC6_9PSEU|nr:TIGR03621 family F420-dependent LLM class oxidoreductase [Amycolatopsis rhizosphaerae]TVT35201.1 TIGR03621 family F420-dependent LLM class oxidoreductase [Amycolatopsis rhizosphaerae]